MYYVKWFEYNFFLCLPHEKKKQMWGNIFAYIHGRKMEIIATETLFIKIYS